LRRVIPICIVIRVRRVLQAEDATQRSGGGETSLPLLSFAPTPWLRINYLVRSPKSPVCQLEWRQLGASQSHEETGSGDRGWEPEAVRSEEFQVRGTRCSNGMVSLVFLRDLLLYVQKTIGSSVLHLTMK